MVCRYAKRIFKRYTVFASLLLSLPLTIFLVYSFQRLLAEHIYKLDFNRSNITYLCPYWRGRSGNLMFQYASVYGIAKRNELEVGITSSAELYKIFRLSPTPLTDLSICDTATPIFERRSRTYDEENVNFTQSYTKNYIHKSYLQSWKYFSNAEEDIRSQFTFRKDIIEEATMVIRMAVHGRLSPFSQDVTLVGIHVRRGDFLKSKLVKYGYQVATRKYLEKAMKYFIDRHKVIKFLVFTNPNKDDIKWCRDNIKRKEVVFIEGNPSEVDMCALSMCNHTIMTVGTFGWWGSFLANGTTIYFKDVARNDSEFRKGFSANMSDYFYPGWIGM